MDGTARRSVFLVLLVALMVTAGGCIGAGEGSGESHGSVVSSHTAGTSTSSSTSSSSVILTGNVSFNAVLKVLHGSTVVTKYSYSGTVDYTSKTAVVLLGVTYNPENKQLTGNWHSKKIVIKNGTVKVFNVPPASWSTLSGNVSAKTENGVFYGNPYYALVGILSDMGNKSGNFSVELTPIETLKLLAPMMWGHSPPEVSLHGWVVLENGRVTSALLKGKNGDTEYLFKMEVFG